MQINTVNSIQTDEAIREEALDPTRSFIVQAPAGSGKTGLLTQRFLVLLAIAEAAPEECLAITFTRKAAAEMRDRILQALAHAKNPNAPLDPYEQKIWHLARRVLLRDKELGWDLLHNPNRLKIQTIDAFCAGIARQMPIVSGFGATPAIQEDARDLYQAAAQNLLKAVEIQEPWSPACHILLSHLDNNLSLTVRLLADMLSHRDQWLPYIGSAFSISELAMRNLLESSLETVTQEALLAVAAHAPKAPEMIEMLSLCSDLKGEWPGDTLADLKAWQGLAELLLTEDNTLRKVVTKQQGFPAPSMASNPADKAHFKWRKEQMQRFLKAIESHVVFLEKLCLLRECPPQKYTTEQWDVVWALMQLLPVLVAELTLVFQAYNAIDFSEMSLAALKALGSADAPTDLALGLDYKIRHILVDEFQDTALPQFRLLEQLTAGWQPGDGRTLFLVGDPMQSIYRFREAEVGLFIRAKQQGIGHLVLHFLKLTTNFRSEPALVEWTNTFFKAQFPKEDDMIASAIAFSASTSFKKEDCENSAADVLPVTLESEADVVVDLIHNLKTIDPKGSIALIVRSRHHLVHLLPKIRSAKIAYEGVQLERLIDRPVVQDLLALTRALLHLGDRIAWLAILRMPAVQLSLSDLFLIANHEPALPIWHTLEAYSSIPGLSEAAQNRLAVVVPCLLNALLHYQRLPLRSWIAQSWFALNETIYMDDDAEAYFTVLERLEAEGNVHVPGVLEEKVETHYATIHKVDKQDNILQIMTIHKAKGLEFDTVIVPGMGRDTRPDAAQLLLWEERMGLTKGHYFLMAPIKRVGTTSDPIYTYLKRQEARRAVYESSRLQYVAATRAKKSLYWLRHDINTN